LGGELGTVIRETHEANGVKFHRGRKPVAIQDRNVEFDDGTKLDCDLVVPGIGVRPNSAIAKQAGIATENGMLVDEFLKRNVPSIGRDVENLKAEVALERGNPFHAS